MGNALMRVVLDILKPHSPSLTSFAMYLSALDGVDGVNITLIELDKDTENVKITMEGKDLNYDKIKEAIEHYGASVHSIDEVVAGRKLVEEVTTPQD
ncbi:MAG: hypothetical protein BZ136_05645 [Methanosphaera sp. rholeuAM74]|nr:MAG: hypothetical protein BZ136_05645 [Methanosphaera sp. rholeuAM74]